MRAVRTLLHPDDLAALVERDYDLPAPVTVALLRVGFNDTYAVTDASGARWALRIYLRDKYWIRSDDDIRCELEIVDHLARAGRSVAPPRRRLDGDLLGHLDAPEGERCTALFAFAPGRTASEETLDLAMMHALGAELARVHRALDDFRSDHGRYHLDASLLVDIPLAMVESNLRAEPAPAYEELRALGARIKRTLSSLELEPAAYGLIHADIHRGNILHSPDGGLVLLDFDHCGFGWRAYDLTNFHEGPDGPEHRQRHWSSLLAGYESVRPLAPAERDALPVLTACRILWDVGDTMRVASWAGTYGDPATLSRRTLERARQPLANLAW